MLPRDPTLATASTGHSLAKSTGPLCLSDDSKASEGSCAGPKVASEAVSWVWEQRRNMDAGLEGT